MHFLQNLTKPQSSFVLQKIWPEFYPLVYILFALFGFIEHLKLLEARRNYCDPAAKNAIFKKTIFIIGFSNDLNFLWIITQNTKCNKYDNIRKFFFIIAFKKMLIFYANKKSWKCAISGENCNFSRETDRCDFLP